MDAAITTKLHGETLLPSWKLGRWIPVACVLAGLAVLPMDVTIASIFKDKQPFGVLDRPLREALENCEVFGNGFGASLIVIAIAFLAPLKRPDLPWVVAGSLGSGLVANALKLCVHRTRPVHFDLMAGTVWNTFDQSLSGGAGMQSFPSAHTATAVGLAVMLTSLVPQGKRFFFTMAVLVGMQRIVSSAHFPSDVCAGAAIGWLVGTACARLMLVFSVAQKHYRTDETPVQIT